jgi:hypothetical protein
MCEPVKRFKVQAWWKKSGYDHRPRFPWPDSTIYAPNGLTAAFMYAALYGIRHDQWYEVGDKPPIVIRVEEVE